MEQNWGSGNKLIHLWSIEFQEGCQDNLTFWRMLTNCRKCDRIREMSYQKPWRNFCFMPGLLIVVTTNRWMGSGFPDSSCSAKVTPYKSLYSCKRKKHIIVHWRDQTVITLIQWSVFLSLMSWGSQILCIFWCDTGNNVYYT